MSDLISKEKLLESLIHCSGLGRKSFEAVIKTINEQPPVEPARGKWQPYTISNLFTHTCTACHCDVKEKTPFCPWCGADMRKK